MLSITSDITAIGLVMLVDDVVAPGAGKWWCDRVSKKINDFFKAPKGAFYYTVQSLNKCIIFK